MSEKPEIIDGKKLKGAQVAAELLPILSAWGITRDEARRAASALATTLAGMTDSEYEMVRQGMRIKAGLPSNAGAANEKTPDPT